MFLDTLCKLVDWFKKVKDLLSGGGESSGGNQDGGNNSGSIITIGGIHIGKTTVNITIAPMDKRDDIQQVYPGWIKTDVPVHTGKNGASPDQAEFWLQASMGKDMKECFHLGRYFRAANTPDNQPLRLWIGVMFNHDCNGLYLWLPGADCRRKETICQTHCDEEGCHILVAPPDTELSQSEIKTLLEEKIQQMLESVFS